MSCLTSLVDTKRSKGFGMWHLVHGRKLLHSQSRVTAASATVLVLLATGILNYLPVVVAIIYVELVSLNLILLGSELCVLCHCTICTRHPDLVSLDFCATPIFPF